MMTSSTIRLASLLLAFAAVGCSGEASRQAIVVDARGLRSFSATNRAMSDEDLLRISGGHYESVGLLLCEQLTDEGVIAFMSRTKVRRLNVSGCSRLTRACVPSILDNPSLEWLSLGIAGVDDFDIRHVCRRKRKWVYLDLSRADVTNAGLSLLSKCGVPIEELHLDQCHRITVDGVMELAKIPEIRTISVSGDMLTLASIESVGSAFAEQGISLR